MPSFQGPDGAYSQQTYNDFVTKRIGAFGLTEQDFIELVRDTLAARKLAEIIGGGLSADRTIAAQQVASRDQQVTIQLARVALSKFQDELKPTDEELKAEWETTQDKYQTDRKIKISYLIAKPTYPELPKEEAKLPDAVTDEQLRQASDAALAATGGGTVTEVGADDHGYDVEVRMDDGTERDVDLDESFAVIRLETDDD